MPEQGLDGAQGGTGLEQMNRERMAERMWRNRLGEARASGGGRACTLDRSSRDRHLGALAGKEPVAGPVDFPSGAQDRQQLRREHNVAVLLSLALRDAQHHPFAVDGGHREAHGLGVNAGAICTDDGRNAGPSTT